MLNSQGRVVLPEVLDFGIVQRLRECLATAIADQSTLQVDAGKVERVGTPALQILLAAGRDLSAEEREFVIADASDAFRTAVQDLGLEEQFSKWSKA